MTTKQQKWQEIANRGLQDNFDPQTRAKFDEAVKRGLITLPEKEEKPKGTVSDYIAEPMRSVAGGFVGAISSGLGGIYELIKTGDLDKAVNAIKSMQGSISKQFAPETQAGEQGVQDLGKVIQTASEATRPAFAGSVASLPFVDDAGKVYKEGVERGPFEALGNEILRQTESPLAATVASMFPDIVGTTTGGGVASRSAVNIPAGPTTREVARTALSPFTKQSKTKKRMAELLEADKVVDETVGYELTTPKIKKNRTSFEKFKDDILRLDEPKVIDNPFEKEALRQGFDRGVLGSIKNATRGTKDKMLEMVDIAEKISGRRELAQVMRSSNVVGDAMIDRIKKVLDVNRAAGRSVSSEAKKLMGKKVDFDPVVESFTGALEDLGVTLKQNKVGQIMPDFKGSDIQGLSGVEGTIRKIVNRMRDVKSTDAHSLHKLKQYIDEVVTYGKSQKGLSGRASRSLSGLRSDISELLNSNFPDYAKVNKDYSETITAINNIKSVSPRFDPANLSKGYLGTQARKITGNWANKDEMLEIINNIDEIAVKHGGVYDDNILSLNMLADELNSVFGTQARTSFQGEVAKGIKEASRGGVQDIVIDRVADAAEAARGINQEGAFNAIKALLSEK